MIEILRYFKRIEPRKWFWNGDKRLFVRMYTPYSLLDIPKKLGKWFKMKPCPHRNANQDAKNIVTTAFSEIMGLAIKEVIENNLIVKLPHGHCLSLINAGNQKRGEVKIQLKVKGSLRLNTKLHRRKVFLNSKGIYTYTCLSKEFIKILKERHPDKQW